jgi:uncharacterized membrane protein
MNTMTRDQQPAVTFFAIGMIGLGVLALIYGDFALVWQPVPPWVPARTALAYVCGVLMLLGGAGLLFQRTAALSARILFPYLVIWTLLKVPALLVGPQHENVWLGVAELSVLLAGGWTLRATLAARPMPVFATGDRGVRLARILFGAALLPIGLAHIVYVRETADLVPAWLPYRDAWAYLTGAIQLACGLGVLLSILPRLAATIEASLLTLFTLLVWIPALLGAPTTRLPWTAFFISWAITAGAWVVANNYQLSARSAGVGAEGELAGDAVDRRVE